MSNASAMFCFALATFVAFHGPPARRSATCRSNICLIASPCRGISQQNRPRCCADKSRISSTPACTSSRFAGSAGSTNRSYSPGDAAAPTTCPRVVSSVACSSASYRQHPASAATRVTRNRLPSAARAFRVWIMSAGPRATWADLTYAAVPQTSFHRRHDTRARRVHRRLDLRARRAGMTSAFELLGELRDVDLALAAEADADGAEIERLDEQHT